MCSPSVSRAADVKLHGIAYRDIGGAPLGFQSFGFENNSCSWTAITADVEARKYSGRFRLFVAGHLVAR